MHRPACPGLYLYGVILLHAGRGGFSEFFEQGFPAVAVFDPTSHGADADEGSLAHPLLEGAIVGQLLHPFLEGICVAYWNDKAFFSRGK